VPQIAYSNSNRKGAKKMLKLEDLKNPEFLEAAAAELRQEAERIQAAAQRLKASPQAELATFEPEGFFREYCSAICSACCMCSPC
jgi:hypothetical protein